MELADIRREYTKGGLRRKDLKADQLINSTFGWSKRLRRG